MERTRNEWNHLVSMQSSPASTVTKTQERAANRFQRASNWIQNHKARIRNYYQVQYARRGTAGAVTATANEIGRVLYRKVIDKQRYADKVLNRMTPGTGSKNEIRRAATTRDWKARFSSASEDVTVSVVIPTKNAGADFRPLLSMLTNQKGFKSIEIIIVDSGSTDQSLEAARDLGTTIVEIAPAEFSHSHARNMGAVRATGDYILFMVQDALPPHDTWLRELYEPIQSQGVVAASCGESPRRNADLFYRTLSWNHHRFLDIQNSDKILRRPKRNDYGNLRANSNVSDTACLIQRDVFLNYKFRGDYAEDIDLGLRLIQDGHKLALLGSTRVIHSHNRPAYYHLKRGYVDSLSLRGLFKDYPTQLVEAGNLMEDILGVYERLDVLFANDLGPSLKLCPASRLETIIMAGLAEGTRPTPLLPPLRPNWNVDESFQEFIESVYRHHSASNGGRIESNGALLADVRAFVMMMLQYMRPIYGVLDEPLLDDFRKSIFKAFAFISGVWLAAGVGAGSDSTRKTLAGICTDLRQSV